MDETVFLKNLGMRIAALRKERGLSQEEFADAAGKMINTISNLERGRTDPKITTLLALANTLNVSVQDLLEPCPTQPKPCLKLLRRIIRMLEVQDERALKLILRQIQLLLEAR